MSAIVRLGGRGHDPGLGPLDPSRPLGVYVHFPFCSVRCPYCDFAVDVRTPIPHDEYASAVTAELEARRPWFAGVRLSSIYFGGGTPGLWRPDALARVLGAIRAAFGGGDGLEITVEANPGEVAPAHLRALRAAGVNRLSLGVQAVDDGLLAGLGRNHDGAAGARAVEEARAAGFDNISCDLMFGVPGQSLDEWRRALESVIALTPEHLSVYALTVERGTAFGALDRAGRLARPSDDAAAEMFTVADDALAAAGYEHYEVSSYARPGRRAVHNRLYWTGGAYLGLGASAASFRPLADGSGWRWTNARATDTYLRRLPGVAQAERRQPADLENEAIWLSLRTSDGVDRAAHAGRFGADPLALPGRAAAADRCAQAGWLRVSDRRLWATRAGWLFADEMAARLWSG